MTTQFIGLKELRQNLSRVAKRAHEKNERYIVLRKNEPIFELRPLSKKERKLEELLASIRRAEEDVKAGRIYSLEEVAKELGL
jgi:antitoxin (DNA-binding transcriptional repressor) of toxin-antitoxin stability system